MSPPPPPSAPSVDPRPPCLDASALSPLEYPTFTKWARQIQSSPSGVQGLLDEQDALAWLRRECAVSRVDEVKILSLFDRYPLGLEAGHFYALLRLTAWLQQGHPPTRPLIFSQTAPPAIGLKQGATLPLPTTLSSTITSPPHPPPPSSKVPPPPPTASATANQQPAASLLASSPETPLQQPLIPSSSRNSVNAPVLPDKPRQPSAKSPGPSNPFRDATHSRSTSLNIAASTIDSSPIVGGRDSPSNPFRQSKPKLYKPTPMVASPSNPNPAASIIEHSGASTKSARSVRSNEDGFGGLPPLPPRPNDKPPPPLPPRSHVSPLIQAGLQASMQVRKQKDALPPKTFTVLHSSSSRQKASEPRLLTGESVPLGQQADMLPPPPTHIAKRKVSGHDSRKSISDVISQVKRGSADDTYDGPQRAVSGSATVIAAPKPSRPGQSRHHHRHHGEGQEGGSTSGTSHTASHVATPKARYATGAATARAKPNLPSWLREQEELQRSALIEGRPLSPPPADAIADDSDDRDTTPAAPSDLERSRRATTVLDEEFDVFPTELNEQASRAASIDRPNNPFIHRSSQVEAEKLKIEPLPRPHHGNHRLDRPSSAHPSPDLSRPLGRSKTLHGKAPPPPPPAHPAGGLNALARKRLESFPTTLDSGTFAGFRQSTQGGLRLTPQPAKADVGLGELKRPIPRRDSSALSVSSSSGAAPMSAREDEEDSAELSLASTNPTSYERPGAKRSDSMGAAGAVPPSGLGNSIKDRVSDFLKLQDAPPKGQRPIDDLKRDAMRLAERRGWIRRNNEGDGLLREEDEDQANAATTWHQTQTSGRVSIDGDDAEPDGVEQDEEDIFDDAPMPDDAYGREDDMTPTIGDERIEEKARSYDSPARVPPALPPKRASTLVSTTAAAPVARRPSGYVARRASRIEEREERESRSGSAASLGRAASFSARSAGNRTGSGGAGSGNVSKRASWLESMDARRRVASEGVSGVAVHDDDDDDDDEGDDEGEQRRRGAHRDPEQAGWEPLR